MKDIFVQIKRLVPGDVEHLSKCAKDDGHGVISATHLVTKGEQTIGYIGSLPLVTCWLDTQRTNMRDALLVQNFWENIHREGGHPAIAVGCEPVSPFFPFLPKVGYLDINARALFKNL
jgi:hypothetical protein